MNKFLVGLILGIAIAGGLAVYLSNTPIEFTNKNITSDDDAQGIGANGTVKLAPSTKLQEQGSSTTTNTTTNELQEVPDNAEHESKQSYDFFDVLQTKKVANEKAPNATPTPQPVKPMDVRYYVQAGSYTNYADAEDIKGQIAFMGLDAKIIKDKSSSQQINRVVLGPIPNEDLANQVKNKLRDEGINATVFKQSNN